MILLKEAINRGLRDKVITYSVILTVLFYIFRSSVPVFKYPFILLFFCMLGYSLIVVKNRVILTLSDFFRNYYLVILTTIILICSFLLSQKIYLIIFKDCLNSIILVTSAYIMSVFINTRQEANSFYQGIVKSIVYFAAFISIDSLCKLFNIFTVNPIIETDATLLIYKDIDYNFAILPVVIGMIGALYLIAKTRSSYLRITYNSFLILFSTVIILSGSRRGVFVFAFLVLIILIAQIPAFSNKSRFLKDLGLATRIYVLVSGLLSVIAFFLMTCTSYEFKNRALKATGSKNILSSKITIASKFYKYYQLVNDEMIFTDFYDRFWTSEFNPYDPESSWGKRMHKTVFPLTGKNVEMIPVGAKGYLMDRSCNANTWNGDAYSFTVIKSNIDISEDKLLEVSVFCYMSEDFNGSWAKIICGGQKMGTRDGLNYDTLKKGIWQKLTCKISNVTDKIDATFYFCKTGVTDFSDLQGYIIFAYPFYEIRENKTEGLSNLIVMTNPNRYSRANFGNFAIPFYYSLLQNQKEKEMIRDLASRIISEDTTYYAYKKDLKVSDANNDFVRLRSAHWKFTKEIFFKEYNLNQKIFGGGFSFLNWFSYYFSGDKTKYDYPHNPFLSVLLYSGILGLIIYLFLFYKVISYYIRYRKEYPLLLYFFLVVFFFSFFSGGSPLDPPIMGFFVILPFVLHNIQKKKNYPEGVPVNENEKNSHNSLQQPLSR